jgi:lipoprotein-anchoring transpeptidase ErfK/SrfK
MTSPLRAGASALALLFSLSFAADPVAAASSTLHFAPSQPARHAFFSRGKVHLNPIYMRQVVRYTGRESPGTLVVDTRNYFLYLILGDGRALRYGIGVAKSGFEWSGIHRITNKREWPDWTPPAEMLKRRPELPRHMEGGINNPLGARALYIGSTLYRIHGTNEPWTIGSNVSSGCIRMTNDDVVDLFSRVKVGSKVIVM